MDHALERVGSRMRAPWFEYGVQHRAVFQPKKSGEAFLKTCLSAKKKKTIRRAFEKLNEAGPVHWRVIKGDAVGTACVETFLKLEDMGWKGAGHTSLRSHPNHEAFFREMIGCFAREGRVFFTELAVGDKVIASTSNLLSGCAGFAFKIGWDTAYYKLGPGVLNEVEFVRNIVLHFPDMEWMDSGAGEESFIERLWPDRRALTSGFFAMTRFAKAYLSGRDFLRRAKRRCLLAHPQFL